MKLFFAFVLMSVSAIGADAQSSPTRIYALVVGISKYEDQHIPTLNFADKDAEDFKKYLSSTQAGEVPPENITHLSNEKATRKNILTSLYNLIHRCDTNDMLIFYYSGHGINGDLNTGFFLPYDSEKGAESVTALSMDEVKRIIDNCPAKIKVSFIDACHAGKFTGTGKGVGASNINLSTALIYGLSSSGKANVAFMSATESQESNEDSKFRNGIFTHFLLEGLMGGADKAQRSAKGFNDGIVMVKELKTFMENNVQTYTGFTQIVKVANPTDEDFPLSVLRKGTNLESQIFEYNIKIPASPNPVSTTIAAKPEIEVSKLSVSPSSNNGIQATIEKCELKGNRLEITVSYENISTQPQIDYHNEIVQISMIDENGNNYQPVKLKMANVQTDRKYQLLRTTLVSGVKTKGIIEFFVPKGEIEKAAFLDLGFKKLTFLNIPIVKIN